MMEKSRLVCLFNCALIPFNFRKQRGMMWKLKGKEITEVIFLQKSMYAERYYFHYDYIINGLHDVKSKTHTMTNALSEKQKYDEYCLLLDLGNDMSDEEREIRLLSILEDTVKKVTGSIRTEKQLKELIASRGWCESLSVKKYLQIPL